MTFTSVILLAQRLTTPTFEWRRIQSNSDWILPVVVCAAIMFFVGWMYYRDAKELNPVLGVFLAVLRMLVFVGLLVLYLQPQWRVERKTLHNSRALLLVDTSMSMGLTDAGSGAAGRAKSRIQQVAVALNESDLLDELRKTHDVIVFQFNDDLDRDRVVSLKKIEPEAEPEAGSESSETDPAAAAAAESVEKEIAWSTFLTPRGSETRLGQALLQLLHDESGETLSGIIVFSDGGQNAGIKPQAAIDLASREEVPLFTIGLGSATLPVNVRVADLVVPKRVYPGDQYTITGFLQAQGMGGEVVEVQLLSREAATGGDASEAGTGQIEERRQVTLGSDGEIVPVKFEMLPPDIPGRRTLCIRVRPPGNDSDPNDNFREGDIEIVDRKNRVMVLAGRPMREYRFLRNLLYRDRSTTVDVLLQSAQPGISQDADKLLDDFPVTREEMFEYDCVVAFDPDWQALSQDQIDLLETWVAEQGGGLIVVAGPVFTGRTVTGWVEDRRMGKIRNLYPVEFHRAMALRDEGMIVSREPWPLEFTREGLEARFLQLDDEAPASAWAGFPGIYSYCPVRGPKPGATVLARPADPNLGEGSAVFFASHFYGVGRVFHIGSGEMWRLRRLDDDYFARLYTKLIRHVSQGRLLRGSRRGALLVAQDRYLLGNTVEVRAELTDSQFKPLEAPKVDLQVVLPDGSVQTIGLEPAPDRVGTYMGRFPVLQQGDYRLELPIPESAGKRLTQRIDVAMPRLESKNTQRNDDLLKRIAKDTGGRNYVGLGALLGATDEPIASLLKDCTRETKELAEPDPKWEEEWMLWMMIALCSLLCLEWLIRRLSKLA